MFGQIENSRYLNIAYIVLAPYKEPLVKKGIIVAVIFIKFKIIVKEPL